MTFILKRARYIIIITVAFLFTRCAQIGVLGGGERDVTPPKLVGAIPANASLNFTGGSIELKFDEFVQVKDIANQVIITPQTKEMPSIEARGKKVLVNFAEALKPNTTYRIYFGNSISDMHEANPVSNFEYVFSTGNSIDSLKLKGTVINAFNLKPEKDVIVALYSKDDEDSVTFKKKPMYFSKTDDKGAYKISYLPKEAFKTFAFTDRNKNLLYDAGEEQIGFRDTSIEVGTDTISNFKIFKEEQTKKYIKRSISPYYGLAQIIYNKETEYTVIPMNNEQKNLIKQLDVKNDTCLLFYHGVFDSLKVMVKHKDKPGADTLNISIPSEEQFTKQKKDKRARVEMEVQPLETGKLKFTERAQLVFSKWMDHSKTDTTRIILSSKTDSLVQKQVSIVKTAINRVTIDTKLKPGNEYKLLLMKGAFTDMDSIPNDSTTITITTTKEEIYGNLGLKLVLPKKENYIVQLVNMQEKVIAEQYASTSLASSQERVLNFKLLLPGEYFVKLIEDKNNNKKWDTGDHIRKKQPETIYFNTQAIKLLADWDADIEWKVSE